MLVSNFVRGLSELFSALHPCASTNGLCCYIGNNYEELRLHIYETNNEWNFLEYNGQNTDIHSICSLFY